MGIQFNLIQSVHGMWCVIHSVKTDISDNVTSFRFHVFPVLSVIVSQINIS